MDPMEAPCTECGRELVFVERLKTRAYVFALFPLPVVQNLGPARRTADKERDRANMRRQTIRQGKEDE